MTASLSDAAGTFEMAGKKVARLGSGAMRLTGPGVWGEPDDRREGVRVVRRAVGPGVQLIDTADSYGPYVSEEIIREAIHPYRDDVLIATRAGLTRSGPDVIETADEGPVRLGPVAWPPVERLEYLRRQALMSLRRLGVDHIDLFQLHRIDPAVPLEDQVGELKRLQDEGSRTRARSLRSVGLSQVTIGQIEQVRAVVEVATVQNRCNLTDRGSADVLENCTGHGIGFIPWAPVAAGEPARTGGPVDRIATTHHAAPSQVAPAWLPARSRVVLPIPGTSKVAHLEENLAAAPLRLSDAESDELTAAA
ncbi:aldo/keto reductase [Streptomyces rimosus]|uniref:aldo/keto reductase n=1 Tax=Streptomyces rimosus TaxID=1927 RepID=UPI0004C5F7A1|nr:aldo/keto reductase [Streptomyces rimosus]